MGGLRCGLCEHAGGGGSMIYLRSVMILAVAVVLNWLARWTHTNGYMGD